MQPGSAAELGLSLFARIDDLQREVAELRQIVSDLQEERRRKPAARTKLRLVEFLERHPKEVTEGQVRAWIFARDRNGLGKSGALSKPGKCWLVDEDRFLRWMESRPC